MAIQGERIMENVMECLRDDHLENENKQECLWLVKNLIRNEKLRHSFITRLNLEFILLKIMLDQKYNSEMVLSIIKIFIKLLSLIDIIQYPHAVGSILRKQGYLN